MLTFLGWLAAVGLAAISTTANFWFGTLLTAGNERWLYGAIFGLLDCLKIVLPSLAAAAGVAGAFGKHRAAIALFLLLSSLSFTASIGLYATTKSEAVGDAKAAHARYTEAKAAKDKADADLAAVGATRPAGEIEGDIAAAKRDRLYDRSRQCTDATATDSRALCAQIDRLSGELGRAQYRARLVALAADAKLALDKQDVAGAMRAIDPQAESIARMLAPIVSVGPDAVRTALAVLIALLIELGSGLGPWLVSPPIALPKRAPAPGKLQPPETADPVTETSRSAAQTIPIEPGAESHVAAWAARALIHRRGVFVPASEVRAAYDQQVLNAGAEPLNANAFGRAMTHAGYRRRKVGGIMRYENVALTTAQPAPLRLAVSNDGRALGAMTSVGVHA